MSANKSTCGKAEYANGVRYQMHFKYFWYLSYASHSTVEIQLYRFIQFSTRRDIALVFASGLQAPQTQVGHYLRMFMGINVGLV